MLKVFGEDDKTGNFPHPWALRLVASIVCEKSINMYLATEFSEGGLITLVPGESPGFGRGLVILIFI